MAAYRLSASGVVRASDGAAIPADQNNGDYRDFLAWQAAGGVPDPYVPPADPLIDPISDRQFFQKLAIDELISQDEALAAVMVGTMPARIQQWVDQLPDDQKFAARMILCGGTQFYFAHAMTAAFFVEVGMDTPARETFWREAGAL